MENLIKKEVKVAREDLRKTELAVYDVPELPVRGFNPFPGLAPYDEPFLFAIRVLRAWKKKGCVQLMKREAIVYLLTEVERYATLWLIDVLVREGYFREEEGWFVPETTLLSQCYPKHDDVSIQLA